MEGTHLTVNGVLAQVDNRALQLVTEHADTSRQPRQVVLCDPDDPLPPLSGSVALLPGQRTRLGHLPAVIAHAQTLGFACIIVKADPGAVAAALATLDAQLRSFPVLAASEFVSWTDLDVLISSLIASDGVSPGSITPITRRMDAAGGPRDQEGPGSTLSALCNSLASVFNGSVVVESLEQHILAYSSLPGQLIDPSREQTILARQVPDLPYHREQYLTVLMSRDPVYLEARNNELARVAIPIRSGKMPLGTIWAITAYDGLTPEQSSAITEAARIAALSLLRASSSGEFEARLRSRSLAEALQSPTIPASLRRELALRPGDELCFSALALLRPAEESAPPVERIGIEARRYLAAYSPSSVSTVLGEKVYVLTPDSLATSRRLMEALSLQLDKLMGVSTITGIARLQTGLQSLAEARDQADVVVEVYRVCRAAGQPCTATIEEVQLPVMISKLAELQREEPHLEHRLLSEIAAHDDRFGTQYLASLDAWCGALFDVANAAARLGIHANSLRYRLKKVETLFSVSLENPDTVLSIWLQIEMNAWARQRHR